MKYSIMTILALTFSTSLLAVEKATESTPAPVARVEADLGEVISTGGDSTPSATEVPKTAVTQTAATDNNTSQQQRNKKKNLNGEGTAWAQECSHLYTAAKQDPSQQSNPDYQACISTMEVSKSVGNGENLSGQGAYSTADGRATCMKVAGYTVDYKSCVSAAKLYDGLLVSSQALELQAEVRAKNSQKEIAQKAQQQSMAGDVQGAGLQASKDNSSTMKQINNEKAVAYTAAVAALGATVAKWIDDEKDYCKKDQPCLERIGQVKEKAGENDIFANTDVKSVFIQAIAEYTAKGIAAGIAASQYKSSEEAVAKIQNTYEEDLLDVQLDECVINPTAKKCLGPGTRVAGESFAGGTGNFSVGGAGSNAFDLGTGQEGFGEFGEETNIESQQVAGINSPFIDEAKEANDILDQAAAASAGSGEGAAPGGGGGGGGMGGGGSASLGNDTKTPDETTKEAEIKATKSNVAYGAGAGAKGFSGVKSAKEDSNPFASLFDQKGSTGGLEEDRSIASNDIDDKSSVLFQKISKKYSEMHSSKRIQANNLELE